LQNSETIATVTITASGGTAATDGTNTYSLTPSAATGGTFAAGNYSLTYNAGTVTVNSLTISLTGSRGYDGTTNAAAAILSVANTVGSDNVTVASGTGGLAGAGIGTQAITSLGTLALGGIQASNYTLTGASGSVTITQSSTTVMLSSSSNPAGYLDNLTFTANVTPSDATGSVTFYNGATPFSTNNIVAGVAISAGINTLPRGTNTITAIYGGEVNYLAGTNSLDQIVTNHPPVANNVSYYRGSVNTFKFKLSDLLTNTSDADGDTAALVSFSTSTNGTMLTTNGAFNMYYNPNLVNDQLTYTVSDGFGGSATGTITLTSQAFLTGQNASVSVGGSTATVNFAGIPGYNYSVQRSTNLVDWTSILTTNAPSNGLFKCVDDFSDLGVVPGSAYYRLQYNP
ncbi:MAG: Ig-like domain repeat protein, partial [Verrucomicrobia bacterium]|nr:Ig-like domain repeat protein [Verrucomicrobiota bacterium]